MPQGGPRLRGGAVDAATLVAALGDLGVAPGDGLVVHSSLSSFGHLRGGAREAVRALQEAVTERGTLVMPSFNHGRAFGPGATGYYSPVETPTTNGAIPDAFWRLDGVHRSLNPTHAFAAWGRSAERYVRHHHRTLTMGPASPLGLLGAEGGYGLLLGVGYRANTFHHVVEMSTGAPCLGRRTEAYPVLLPDGRRVLGRTWGWRAGRCPYTDEQRYVPVVAARGLERRAVAGRSEIVLFRLADCFAVVAEMLTDGADGYPPCSGCPIRPRVTEYTVPSDFDDERGRLRPDSEAWTY